MDLSSYLGLFVSESRDHLSVAFRLAERLERDPEDEEALQEIFRRVHSLKGTAATMRLAAIADLAHACEDLLQVLRDRKVRPSGEHAALLGVVLACVRRLLARAERGEPLEDPFASDLVAQLRAAAAAAALAEAGAARDAPPGRREPAPEGKPAVRVAMVLDRSRPYPAVRAAAVLGRLAALGRIVASDPPMATLRSGRFDGRLAVLLDTERSAEAIGTIVASIEDVDAFSTMPGRLPPVPTRAEATPWVRLPASAIDSILDDIRGLEREIDLPDRTGRVQATTRRIQRNLVEMRLVPFEAIAGRLLPSANDLATSLGKEVDIRVEGGDVRVDRVLIDSLGDPLRHLVRNALVHGIESRDERQSSGKRPRGFVSLRVERRGARVHVAVEDDGRGLDTVRLRTAAVESGLISAVDAARMDETEAFLLTTRPGFSTSEEAHVLAGRGVGLDVVRATVEALGGSIAISSKRGRGTRVEMDLPLTVAVIQAMIVISEGQPYAVPIDAIERAIALEDGPGLPTVWLGQSLGSAATPATDATPFALVLRGSRGAFVLASDEIVGEREVVVRPIRGPASRSRAVSGAAILDGQRIALVLDADRLAPAPPHTDRAESTAPGIAE